MERTCDWFEMNNKVYAAAVFAIAVCMTVGCNKSQQYTLVTDSTWTTGEARTCSLDGKWHEAHCFPPTKTALAAPKTQYLVEVRFDQPKFDKDGWAYDFTCRLDSVRSATCVKNVSR
jgi:hypothetical protein